ENNGVVSKTTTKEKVKPLTLKAKVTREQTSDDSDSQGGSDENVDEEEAEAFNLMARNFRKFFRKGIDLGATIDLVIVPIGLEEAAKITWGTKVVKAQDKREFSTIAGEDGDEPQNDATCLMAIDSQELYDGGHVVFGRNLKGKVVDKGNIAHDSITITNVEHVSGLAFTLISVGYSLTSKAYIVLNKETMGIEESLNVTFDESLPEPKSSPSVEDDRNNEHIVQDLNGSPS
ncbi:hypothetical protein Tco_0025188, partial [Tanacetum coccineum]